VGSSPTVRTTLALVAQWLELTAHNRLVGGSNPSERTTFTMEYIMDSSEIISEYWSDDGRRKAEVVCGVPPIAKKFMYVRFYEDGKMTSCESYDGHSVDYYESAAENYVLGIKHV
jgi:hypothetical protein